MKGKVSKFNRKKILIISIGCLLGFILLVSATGYFIMRSYVSKINYVPLKEEDYTDTTSSNYEESDYDEDFDDDSSMPASTDTMEGANSSSNNTVQPTEDLINGDISNPSEGELDIDKAIDWNIADASMSLMKDKNVLNVLLIGTDNRISGERGLSDSMILVSLNTKTERIIATSLLRDIYVKIPGKKNNNRLNIAYASGGTKLLIETIETNFKISIDKYASVDFFSFIDIVDQVGGITLEVTKAELPYVNRYIREINELNNENIEKDCLSEPGIHLLNGKQALGYARVRYVGTDFGRTARQRKVLELIYNKIKQMKMSEIGNLLNVILPEVTTNFTRNEMMAQIMKLPGYLSYDLESWSIPMKGTYKDLKIRKMEVLGIDFNKNIEELYRKIYLTD